MKIMGKAQGIVKLIRPINCMVLSLAVLTGMVVSIQGFPLTKETIIKIPLSVITGFAFLAAANAINDHYDREVDAINEPTRPIPSGVIQPREALGYAFILSTLGFITAFLTSPLCLIVAAFGWILSTYYSTKGKRTGLLGNFIVGACIALPFIYGGFAIIGELNRIIIMFANMAFLSTTGREITKGIVDIHGDKILGIKTVAVLYGSRIAAVVAFSFYIASIIFSFIPWIFGKVSVWYLPPIVFADLGFVLSSISLIRNYSPENAKKVKKRVLIWMAIGLLAFVLGTWG